jgi:hypothetical protein
MPERRTFEHAFVRRETAGAAVNGCIGCLGGLRWNLAMMVVAEVDSRPRRCTPRDVSAITTGGFCRTIKTTAKCSSLRAYSHRSPITSNWRYR